MKQVKIIGLILLFMAVYSFSHAQKCKFDYEKTDKISGETVKGISNKINGNWAIGFVKEGENYFVSLDLRKPFKGVGTRVPILEAGESLMLKLSNDEVITLTSARPVSPRVKQTSLMGADSFYDGVLYAISSEDMGKLEKNLLKHLRVEIYQEPTDVSLKEKESAKFQEAANCILK